MDSNLDQVQALTFDVGGTVFDWHHTIRDEVSRLSSEREVAVDAAGFANAWRREMFRQLSEVRRGELPWMNADQLHRRALDVIGPRYPSLGLSMADRDELNTIWHRLRVWPDFPAVLPRLRRRYTVTVLTVLSFAIVVDCSKRNDLWWDAITSCEVLGHYKPDTVAYQAGVRLLGLKPEQALMVACHPGDLRAAGDAGLHTAYVSRPAESGDAPGTDVFTEGNEDSSQRFDVSASDFTDLADRLGA